MSKIINFSTGTRADVVGFLGAAGKFTAEQERVVRFIRERAEADQRSLDRQGVDWGLPVPEALEHLLAGRADSDAEYAGNAYYTALQHIIDCNTSAPGTLAGYSSPSTFFELLEHQLRRAGVPRGLLPGDFLYSGPPDEIPFAIPAPEDGSPEIGCWPLAQAKPAADAYRAAREGVDPDFRTELDELIQQLDVQAGEWAAHQGPQDDWYTQDTIFFSIVG
ncbi:hypothetical protein DSC45_20920 [Streptomyces sp. YIM 130001]|uniref:DUF7691 family protein n=1 Tax=Streptomyces sp. YIM 130001 TaxID=2259644 RepID=UPI000E652454|nr:hypothetical protein [Streptomyces sp. YIM 130001]RII14821.1 hypothetical protein DSC45_20920 [Streptomyces sp. YIM 130001]